MTSSATSTNTPRRIRIRRIRVAGLLVVRRGDRRPASSASPRRRRGVLASTSSATARAARRGRRCRPRRHDGLRRRDPGRRQPRLRSPRRPAPAATDAADDGVEFVVNSGWRSPAYQEQLLREAVSKYGSEAEAARWVATPNTSAHVSGDAVDIGPSDAAAWLSEHGAAYGLCQIYGNEPWHYELRPDAVDHGCPPMYADPTHDPRMQP